MCSTLPRRVRIIFSDLDGTLVHFEKHFRGHGSVHELGAGTATYRSETGPSAGTERNCRLLPTSTMGAGLFSERSAQLIAALRKAGVVFVYISGARRSTMLERIPLLAPADFAVAETGGRMYVTAGSNSSTQLPPLETAWTQRIEAACGPIEDTAAGGGGGAPPPVAERQGALWEWCRELQRRGVQCDTRSYTCCFRVDCKKPLMPPGALGVSAADTAAAGTARPASGGGAQQQQQQQQQQQAEAEQEAATESALRKAMREALPEGVTCAQNLGKFDFFPSVSGKGKAAEYLLAKLGIDPADAVALFDDENDLPMAAACAHACVLGCTHDSIAASLRQNPHWHVATEHGVLATEEVLQMLLENAQQ